MLLYIGLFRGVRKCESSRHQWLADAMSDLSYVGLAHRFAAIDREINTGGVEW